MDNITKRTSLWWPKVKWVTLCKDWVPRNTVALERWFSPFPVEKRENGREYTNMKKRQNSTSQENLCSPPIMCCLFRVQILELNIHSKRWMQHIQFSSKVPCRQRAWHGNNTLHEEQGGPSRWSLKWGVQKNTKGLRIRSNKTKKRSSVDFATTGKSVAFCTSSVAVSRFSMLTPREARYSVTLYTRPAVKFQRIPLWSMNSTEPSLDCAHKSSLSSRIMCSWCVPGLSAPFSRIRLNLLLLFCDRCDGSSVAQWVVTCQKKGGFLCDWNGKRNNAMTFNLCLQKFWGECVNVFTGRSPPALPPDAICCEGPLLLACVWTFPKGTQTESITFTVAPSMMIRTLKYHRIAGITRYRVCRKE